MLGWIGRESQGLGTIQGPCGHLTSVTQGADSGGQTDLGWILLPLLTSYVTLDKSHSTSLGVLTASSVQWAVKEVSIVGCCGA